MSKLQSMRVTGLGLSHVGRVRRRNEDALGIDPDGRFALIADGMGGHKGGQEASRMTIRIVSEILSKKYSELCNFSDEDLRAFIREIFQDTSRAVFNAGEQDQTLAQMGTTLVSWILFGERYYLSHVGDSRAYLLRDDGIFQLTMDHSYVNEQIATGVERDKLLYGHRFKNAIFRNIGMMPPSEPVTLCGDALRGDVWLMCSDGLSNKMEQDDIMQVVSEFRGKNSGKSGWFLGAAHALIDLALERGGEDNISVLIFELK